MKPTAAVFRQESGFTLIEMLIALQMGILIIGFAYLGFQFIGQYARHWQIQQQEEQQFALISTVISQVFDSYLTLDSLTESEIMGSRSSGTLQLTFRPELAVNGKALLQPEFHLENYQLSFLLDSGINSLDLLGAGEISERNKHQLRGVALRMTVRHRRKTRVIRITSRFPRLGEPIRAANGHRGSAVSY